MCKPHRAAKPTILNNYNKEQVQQKVLLEIEEKLLKKKKPLCVSTSLEGSRGVRSILS